MKAYVGRHRYFMGLRGRLECVLGGTVVCYRTMFGTIKDPDGQHIATCHGGFNKIVYRFRGGEGDLTLQYGWLSPRYFASESWRGELTEGQDASMRIFFAGEKRFAWDQADSVVRFDIADPAWTWRDTVIAFRAFDYFNPPDG